MESIVKALKAGRPLGLTTTVQNYEWGHTGKDSLVARLASTVHQEKVPYAELWIGAHPKSPSNVELDGIQVPLDQLIAAHPEMILGPRIFARFGANLPFLTKVLSIKHALSLQAHPDAALAKQLHASNPSKYPDPHHKPELAIALEPTKMLYGFKSISDLSALVKDTPELGEIFGTDLVAALPKGGGEHEQARLMKVCYEKIITTEPKVLAEKSRKLRKRINTDQHALSAEVRSFNELAERYGDDDIGPFSSLLMNYVNLLPGQAVFIEPNTLHAYLSGSLFEVMANSDNVVRGGLTEKTKDPSLLLKMLEYRPKTFTPIEATLIGNQQLYSFSTPASEFHVQELVQHRQLHFLKGDEVNILFCIQGNAELSSAAGNLSLSPGSPALIPSTLPSYDVRLIDDAKVFHISASMKA